MHTNFKPPYLIQYGKIIQPLASRNVKLSDSVDLECMGSSEFEFGATARSLRRIQHNLNAFRKDKEFCDKLYNADFSTAIKMIESITDYNN